MENLVNNDLSSIKAFIDSCNDMINGKFILADVKISKILNMISVSEPLYKYIQECLIDFNFEKEFNRSEVKNKFNNGVFTPPSEPKSLVAMVYSLLVKFDSKKMDFYSFINTNFQTLVAGGEYALFAKTLLVPFKDIISRQFNISKDENVVKENNIAKEESMENILEEKVEEVVSSQEKVEENKQVSEEKIWKDLPILIDSMMNCVMTDRKVKSNEKEQVIYILKSIKYASKYKDIRLVSAFLEAVDYMLKKSTTTKFILNDIKNEVMEYYDLMQASQN